MTNPSVNGIFAAICVDVVYSRISDDGTGTWVKLVFHVDAPGRPTLAFVKFPLVLSSRQPLRGWLEAWRGAAFTDEQADDFDVESCVGVGATVRVQSFRNRSGHLIVRLQQVRALPKADTPSYPTDYVRHHHAVVA